MCNLSISYQLLSVWRRQLHSLKNLKHMLIGYIFCMDSIICYSVYSVTSSVMKRSPFFTGWTLSLHKKTLILRKMINLNQVQRLRMRNERVVDYHEPVSSVKRQICTDNIIKIIDVVWYINMLTLCIQLSCYDILSFVHESLSI